MKCVLSSGLRWMPEERATAQHFAEALSGVLAGQGHGLEVKVDQTPQVTGSQASTTAPASSRRRDDSAAQRYSLQLGHDPLRLPLERELPESDTCNCSGGCRQPKHRWYGCSRQYAVVGSKLCKDCECSWVGCHTIRLWGPWCKMHKRNMDTLSATWQIVRAAGSLNSQLVPCDVDSFNSFYTLFPHCFRECVVVAFVKEPKPLEAFKEALSGVGEKTGADRREYVRLSWRKVVLQVVHEGQDLDVCRQLSRQGAGRLSCLARTMSIIGIIERVPVPPMQFGWRVKTLSRERVDSRVYSTCFSTTSMHC